MPSQDFEISFMPLSSSLPMVFVDLETTGANFANDRIIEIGIVQVDQDGAREWSSLVNPEREISPFISRLTGIENSMVVGAPTFAEVADEVGDRDTHRGFVEDRDEGGGEQQPDDAVLLRAHRGG